MTTFLAFIFVIGTCVLVHEYAHYWVAKRMGIFVEIFSIGFGPVLWKKMIGPTEWRISAIPLGGFVKMKGEHPADTSPDPDSFHAKPPLARMAVVAAGPLSNIVFAVLLLTVLWTIRGIEEVAIRPVIGGVAAGSAAERAGLRKADRILAVDGVNVATFYDFQDSLRRRAGETAVLRVARAPKGEREISVPITVERYEGDDLFAYLHTKAEAFVFGAAIVEGLEPYIAPVIGEAILNRPAQKAGIRPGDWILRVNGSAVSDWKEMSQGIRATTADTVALFLEREGAQLLVVVPCDTEPTQDAKGNISSFRAIGIRPESKTQRLNPVRAMWMSSWNILGIGRMVIVTLKKLFTFQLSLRNLLGPVGIAQVSGETAQRGGDELIQLVILISANLGFVNCVPFPILDGGYLFIFLPYEILRKRPPSPKFVEWTMNAALAALLLFIAVVTYNDIGRWTKLWN